MGTSSVLAPPEPGPDISAVRCAGNLICTSHGARSKHQCWFCVLCVYELWMSRGRGGIKVALPPKQRMAAALCTLLPSTTAVQPLCLYQGESQDTIREWGIAPITPRRHPAELKQPSYEGALRCMGLGGLQDPRRRARGCGRPHSA